MIQRQELASLPEAINSGFMEQLFIRMARLFRNMVTKADSSLLAALIKNY